MKIIPNSITFLLYLVKNIAKHKLAYHFNEGFLVIPKVEHGSPWFERAIT
jgi:hypothetical protein